MTRDNDAISPWDDDTIIALRQINDLRQQLKQRFVDRDTAIDVLTLAVVAQEHVLLVGEPGTAKSQIITSFARLIEARRFEYLLTRFTEPSELFGPLDLARFREGGYHIQTSGMLPEADIVFLDEVFEGSSAILNTLLKVANERIFNNGPEIQRVRVLTLVGATNSLPEDDALRAFSDRFMLRVKINRVRSEDMTRLLKVGMDFDEEQVSAAIGDPEADSGELIEIEALRRLHGQLNQVRIDGELLHVYRRIVDHLRSDNIEISDRRFVRGVRLIKAAALLRGSPTCESQDLWPLRHMWSRVGEDDQIARVLRESFPELEIPEELNLPPEREVVFELLRRIGSGIRAAGPGSGVPGNYANVLRLLEELGALRRVQRRYFPSDADLQDKIAAEIRMALDCLAATEVDHV